jgi:hypothetical protein
MGIDEMAETWVRIDLVCDGFDNDGICLLGASDECLLKQLYKAVSNKACPGRRYNQAERKSSQRPDKIR